MEHKGLYDPWFEHDACGVGFVANVNGQRSHQIVHDGITILKNLAHRGAIGGDSKTGDGAGMLLQLPHIFFAREAGRLGITLPDEGAYGVGMIFLPQEADKRESAVALIDAAIINEGGSVLCWRDVPMQPDGLGDMARSTMPFMRQVFLTFGTLRGADLERRLYLTRKCIESAAKKAGFTNVDLYVAS